MTRKNHILTRICLFWLLMTVARLATATPPTRPWAQILLGQPITPDGIELVQNPNGLWHATRLAGQDCIEMTPNGISQAAYLYFAVDDAYIFNNAIDVFLSIEYWDRGTGHFSIEFDNGAVPYQQAEIIALTATNNWVKRTIVLSQTGFTNQQANGADFRLAIADTALARLAVKNIFVWRAPGPYIAPLHQDFSGETFTADDDLVFTYYFYWYDSYSGAHIWDDAGHTDDALQDHPFTLQDFSFKSVAWHRRELEDLMAAGIDVVLPVYWGSAQEMATWSVEGITNLVLAEQELIAAGRTPPKIGMFFDTSTLQYGEYVLRSATTPTDLNSDFGRAFFFKHLRDFYSLIPPTLWARIQHQPVVWLYAAAFAVNANQQLLDYVNSHFQTSFPAFRPYIVRETSWNLVTANDYAWGAALNGAQLLGVAAVGPGYNDSAVPGRTTPITPRANGDFYTRNWQKVLASGRNLAVVETWNEFHEGTDICHSREYGRQYIDITARSAAKFKQSTKFFAFAPQSWTGVLHPACSLQVQDRKFGIEPASIACEYSENSGQSWQAWPAVCSGTSGSTAIETISVPEIPFTQNASMTSTPNHVRFSIVNANGDTMLSPAFAVFNGSPPDYAAQIVLGAEPREQGVTQSYHRNDDGWSAATTIGGRPCTYNLVANPSPYPGRYLYFNIADTLVLNGSHPEAWITIDYYDTSATGTIELQYDSRGEILADKYRYGGTVRPANTRKWQTKEFPIKNVFFGNRQNGISDFRFYTSGVMFLWRVHVRSTVSMGIDDKSDCRGSLVPAQYHLFQNYPNPFKQVTEIQYLLPHAGLVTVKIYDIQGREVITLWHQQQSAGKYHRPWNGEDGSGVRVSSGLYFCRFQINQQTLIRKMMLLR